MDEEERTERKKLLRQEVKGKSRRQLELWIIAEVEKRLGLNDSHG